MFKKDNMTIFLIFFVFMFFLITYALKIPYYSYKIENYEDSNKLIDKNNLQINLGVQGPDVNVEPTKIDFADYDDLPSVDGTTNGPKSLFMMSFNKCSPEYCENNNSPYTCSGGCVRLTDDQRNFVGSRGFNSRTSKCNEKEF